MIGNLAVQRSKIIHARIQTVERNGQYQFDQQQNNQLFNNRIKLYAIEVFTSTQLIATPVGNYTVFAANAAPSLVFTLVNKATKEVIEEMPVYSAIRSNNGGFFLLFDGLDISIQDSFVKCIDTTNVVANTAVPFNVYYQFADAVNQ